MSEWCDANEQKPMAGCDPLEWLNDNACELVCETSPIADTGDYNSIWVVFEHHGNKRVPVGYGDTPKEAIQDAMKSPEDPTKYDYIPPEYR